MPSPRSASVPALGIVLSGSEDATLRLWEPDAGRCLRTIDDHSDAVTSVAASADGRVALSAGDDGTVRIWQLAPVGANVCLPQVAGPQTHSSLVETHARAEELLSCVDEAERAHDLAAALRLLREARDLPGHERSPAMLSAWRRVAGECTRVGLRGAWAAHTFRDRGGVRCVAALEGRALSAGDEGTIAVWDLGSLSCSGRLAGHEEPVAAVCGSWPDRSASRRATTGPSACGIWRRAAASAR